jgi:hypothetical protein
MKLESQVKEVFSIRIYPFYMPKLSATAAMAAAIAVAEKFSEKQ